MAYSSPDDLLLGNIPLPAYVDKQKIVDDASDEIDSKLGYIYETPFDVSETGPLVRPARLLLKRINRALASGRLILQIASPIEQAQLHAYGLSLVREAWEAIECIYKREVTIEGAELIEDPNIPQAATVPMISNLDAESNVEAFYNRAANPNYVFVAPYGWIDPDRLIG